MPRPGVPGFTGQGNALTRAGVWRAVTDLRAVVGLDPTGAPHLYRASGADLEIVQEQRGHRSIKTTTLYAKVTREGSSPSPGTNSRVVSIRPLDMTHTRIVW